VNEVIESPAKALQVQSETATIVNAITQAALNPDVDVEKMERLWAMHEKIADRDAETAFNQAMTAAQSDMGRISADAVNPQTRSHYATYAQLDRYLRPIYTKHGFSLSFNTGKSDKPDYIHVLCYVSHSAGHTRPYEVEMPADGKGAKGGDVMTKTHATGSAMSYGMRYLLKLIFNVAIGEDDDDGNGGEAPAEHPKLQAGRDAAMIGMSALTQWWAGLGKADQQALQKDFGAMRAAARKAGP
jgi:hypothetical protein